MVKAAACKSHGTPRECQQEEWVHLQPNPHVLTMLLTSYKHLPDTAHNKHLRSVVERRSAKRRVRLCLTSNNGSAQQRLREQPFCQQKPQRHIIECGRTNCRLKCPQRSFWAHHLPVAFLKLFAYFLAPPRIHCIYVYRTDPAAAKRWFSQQRGG
ncbi:hypothetical protein BC832DRAFT_320151 [Gaertneriomyces semiglobifer]|nr:hypothetical protein BC832DRAFT_320151 [Gaertneriomyces semiglobifer]